MIGRSLLLALAVASTATWTDAASVRLRSGATLTVDTASSVGNWALPGAVSSRGLRYTLLDPTGRTSTGIIQGTGDALSGAGVSLAEDPLSGAAYVAYVRPGSTGTRLAIVGWNGRDWLRPNDLTAPEGTSDQPILAFRDNGEAVLAWRWRSLTGSGVLVRDFLLAPTGELQSFSFMRVDHPETFLQPVDGRLGLRDGLAHVVVEPGQAAVDVFFASSATNSAAVLRLALAASSGGTGFNAPPVPVEISTQVRTDSATTSGLFGQGGRPTQDIALRPFHLDLVMGIAYYWTDTTSVSLVTFRDGMPGRLMRFALPADDAQLHATAYAIARAQLVDATDMRLAVRDGVRRGR
jgi:hypothetical protein